MYKFRGAALGDMLLLVGKLTGNSQMADALGAGHNDIIGDETREKFLNETLPRMDVVLKTTGLNLALAYTQRIRWHFAEGPVSGTDMLGFMNQLQERIQDELSQELLFQIPRSNVPFYEQPDLFGVEVSQSFPSALFDIEEAGKCLALARATACVMHLSRVVEVALRSLASEMRLPSRNDWGKHIDDIQKELEKRYKIAGSRTPDEAFYSEAVSKIDHIRTAWRNPTMHVDRVYTDEIAMDIFLAIKSLMRHLATRLHE